MLVALGRHALDKVSLTSNADGLVKAWWLGVSDSSKKVPATRVTKGGRDDRTGRVMCRRRSTGRTRYVVQCGGVRDERTWVGSIASRVGRTGRSNAWPIASCKRKGNQQRKEIKGWKSPDEEETNYIRVSGTREGKESFLFHGAGVAAE